MTGGAYLRVLRAPGVARLAGAFLALGISGTMTPVAFVLFAREATGSFATAGLVLGASTAGGLGLGPARRRLVGRVGPRAAVVWLLIPDLGTDVAFIACGHARLGAGWLVALAFVAGAVSAPATAALRSAWSRAVARIDARRAGYSLTAVLQETAFVVGPLLAGALVALWSPTIAVAAVAGLSFLGALGFAVGSRAEETSGDDRGAADATGGEDRGRGGRVPAGAGIRTVVVASAAFGMTFGLLDVAFPAYARTHGSAGAAGVLLSAFAAGGWVGALAYGRRAPAASAGRRYPVLCLLAASGLAPLIATPGLAAMGILAALAGVCVAPISTSQLVVIDELAVPGHRAEAFTWLGALYGAGLAAGAAVAGALLTASGSRLAIGAACAATTAAWVFVAARASTVRGDAVRGAR